MKNLIGILACDKKGNIGNNGDLLVYLKKDLERFKTLTINSTIVMGRKTFDSIGRLLPGREHIIITRDESTFLSTYSNLKGKVKFSSLSTDEIRDKAGHNNIYIIGGAEIYNQLLSKCDKIELTSILKDFGDCDSKVNLEVLKDFTLKSIVNESEEVRGEEIKYKYLTYIRP